jgi:hypothetical protein
MAEKITAYKAFNADLTCRGFQYEVGKTYTHNGPAEICVSGFHACVHPLDVLNYYPAAGSRFALVEMLDVTGGKDGDTKICGTEITIKAEIHIHEMVSAAVKHVFDAAKWVKKSTTTGYRGAASATGYSGAASATGDSGAASATGYRGAASATGDSGAAMSSGYAGRVMGAEGCALFLVERNLSDVIVAVWAGIAGQDGIKPDVWYTLQDGKPVEVVG